MLKSSNSKIITLDIQGTDFLSEVLIAELNGACDRVEDEGSEAILLININGQSEPSEQKFSFNNVEIHVVNQWERALRRLERLAALTIATATGSFGEIGLAVLLCTDYRIGNENFQFVLGSNSGEIFPAMTFYRLANQIGIAKSRQLILLGGEVEAVEAIELGVVNEIVSNTEESVRAFIASLNRFNLLGLPMRRQLLLETSATNFESALGTHLAACDRVLRRSQD